MPLNLWYINHYATPPALGRGERACLLGRCCLAHDVRVIVVAASRHHLHFSDAPPPSCGEILEQDGVPFFFLPARPYRGNGPARFANMLDFRRGVSRLASAVAANHLPRPDVIAYSSPHPFAWSAVERLSRRLGARLILEVRDLWPLSLVELAGLSRWHPFAWLARRYVEQAYARADAVVALVPEARRLMPGVEAERFVHIPNGIDPAQWHEEPEPLPAFHRQVMDRLQAEGRFVIAYTGSMGPPNALDQVLDLERVPTTSTRPYHFLLVGDGTLREQLEQRAETAGLDFVTFLPPLKKSALRGFLQQCDACFLGWRRSPLYKAGISPNKVFDYMMAGKPILHAVETVADPVEAAGAGLCVPPYSPEALDKAIRKLQAMPAEEREAMGERGRSYVLAHHDWHALAGRFADVCRKLKAGRTPANTPLLEPGTAARSWTKHLLDALISAVLLVLLSPVIGLVGFLVRLRLGRPILFRQERPGLRGRLFELVKFRTMRPPPASAGAVEAVDSDAERLTVLGRFLRKTSLDELPQLWNVLKGDMSLVGPRPLLPEYLSRYNDRQARRHEVKPGITGWAQVNGRNAISWEERFVLDVWYVDNWSLWLDIKILAMTVAHVLRREGIGQEGQDTMEPFQGSAAPGGGKAAKG